MDISETYLTLGAATFELGVPLAAAVALALAPRLRKFAVVLLGALTPLLVAYAFMAASYFFAPAEPSKSAMRSVGANHSFEADGYAAAQLQR